MKKEKLDLFYSGFFQGIGKLVLTSESQVGNPILASVDWLRKQGVTTDFCFSKLESVADLSEKDLTYVLATAQVLATGITDGNANFSGDGSNQRDIFDFFGKKEPTERYFVPKELRTADFPNFPDKTKRMAEPEDYKRLLEKLTAGLANQPFNESTIQSTLRLAEATLSFVPASNTTEGLADISLYEYSKITAGFACALYDYLLDNQRENFKKELFVNQRSFYEEKAFLLASFDISGIQDFIYNIATKGAAKQLKARSLYLDFMGEHIADSLLDTLELTRANLMYIGGGHAYFLLPNTHRVKSELEAFEKRFNQFLLEHFQTKLYVAFGWSEFSGSDIISELSSPEGYRAIYQRASRQISDKKLSRYDWQTLLQLNQGGKKEGRECQICHSIDRLTECHDQTLCHVCNQLREFSGKIKNQYFLVSSDSSGLPIGPEAYLTAIDEKDKVSKETGTVYVKNNLASSISDAKPIFIGDYVAKNIDEYAKASTEYLQPNGKQAGIKRLAVVRLDVDDLGAGFMAGFSEQENGRYNTFSRTAMFSRSMSQFFKVYINHFAKDKQVSIIYAGGDDVFAVGTWQDILLFTVELRQQFRKWTNQKLSLSAGVGLFADKTPVSMMARLTGNLEEAAKENPQHDKDSIAVFDEQMVFAFDDFIEKIYEGKLPIIRKYFNQQDEHGKGFAYQLLELIRSTDRLDIARLAYYLARLEDMSKDDAKEAFKKFKKQFFAWATAGESTKKEVEMALILYIYEIRKDN